MPPTPRGRRKGGPFQISRSPDEVLKHMGITEDDAWWRKLTLAVATEHSQLREKSFDSNVPWSKLEIGPKTQISCEEALQAVTSKLQNLDSILPQWLHDGDQVRQVLKWKFAYQHKVVRDNAITKSKRKNKTPARRPFQDVGDNTSSPLIEPPPGCGAVDGGHSQELCFSLRTEQAADTGPLTLTACAPILDNTIEPSTAKLGMAPALPLRNFKSIPTFICVAAPQTPEQNIEDYPSIVIRCPAEELLEDYNTSRTYDKANMVEMKKKFGVGYADYDTSSEPPIPIIHQDLATWHLLQDFGRIVSFENWAWIHKQAQLLGRPESRCVEQTIAFRPGNHSFVLLLHPGPLDAKLRRSYAILETQVHSSPRSLAIFPALTELEHTCQKLGDLAALEELAAGKHYRPKTCLVGEESLHFPHDSCPLTGEQSYIAKRNNSACSMHVFERDNSIDQKSQQVNTRAEPALGIDRWFYQERVPFLRDVGEFRVFITTVSDPRGIRGRRGKHLHSIFTKPRLTQGFAAFALDDYFWSQHLAACFTPLTQDDLHAFALDVFEGLRAREDWKTYYESLEVGVRLDIGVSPDRRFFVNEITRIWCGDYFSDQTLAEPKRKIVWAVAKALHEYFQ